MKITRALVLLAGLVGCAGSAIEVKTHYDPSAPFDGKTYTWLAAEPTGDPRIDDVHLEKTVRQTADKILAEKGYSRVDKDPDFRMGFLALIYRESATDTRGYRPEGRDQFLDEWFEPGDNERQEIGYEMGTLVLKVAGPDDLKPLWRATAAASVNLKGRQNERDKRLRKAIREMLKRFPP